uniref:CSON006245 protein n=1 Tax=Culicoides sonorensis TaxID=179676 RepID=A0A336LW48_CULSO
MALRKNSRTKSLSLSDDFPLRVARQRNSLIAKRTEDPVKIIKYIDENIIGKGNPFLGPYGRRKLVYANYQASGRSLQFLEDYIVKEVVPAFGDIKCGSSVTGLQSQFKESRDLIKLAFSASDDDDIIFCDNPQDRLCYLLSKETSNNQRHGSFSSDIDIKIETNGSNNESSEHSSPSSHHTDHNPFYYNNDTKPIIFVSGTEPVEHIQSWIDAGAQIERISENHEGFLDLTDLERRLQYYTETKRPLVGYFTGVSRLTGMLADDVATTILLHQYNALSIWDYSSTVSCAPINMNPALPGAMKDALFFHGKSLIGGVQSSGVLIIKKQLVKDTSSILCDSSSVVEVVRTGLSVQLKESLGTQTIMNRQEKICKLMLSHVRTIPEIVLIGPNCSTTKRVSTLCFMVRHPRGTFLHHRFVVAVLNDVFGIQASAHNFMGMAIGISNQLAIEYERILSDETTNRDLSPGYTRITLPFFMSDNEVGFILEALKMVATEGWKLLPQYEIDVKTKEWRHHSNSLAKERKFLSTIRYIDGKMLFTDRRISGAGTYPQSYSDCLQTARNLFNRSRKMAIRATPSDSLNLKLQKETEERLRWYMLPGEAHELLLGHSQFVKTLVPFDPNKLMEPPSLFSIHRHNSLSALDVKRFKSQSLPASPVQMSMMRQSSGPHSPIPKYPESASPPVVRFSLGGEVTCITNFVPTQVQQLYASEKSGPISRNRCYSTSSAQPCTTNQCTKQRSPLRTLQRQRSLYYSLTDPDHQSHQLCHQKIRTCSMSSQTDQFSVEEIDSIAITTQTTPTSTPCDDNVFVVDPLNNNNNNRISGSYSDCNEDIQAYVQEVTKELATEIKSEIREVISKVEDVLENTDGVELTTQTLNSLNNLNSAEELKNDNVSATEVVEYLKDFAKEMTSEVKSEIREVVNEIISPELCQLRKNSPPDILERRHLLKQRLSDTSHEMRSKLNKCHEIVKNRSESVPAPKEITQPPSTGAISKMLVDLSVTASHDSGINLSFSDSEGHHRNEKSKTSRPESCEGQKSESPTIIYNPNFRRGSSILRSSPETETDTEPDKWQNLPKEIWKQAAETIDEYEMLKDGDRVMVAVSGSSSSLCLLHLIRQFTRARGLHVILGAVTIGDASMDPRALMLYMRNLGVEYFYEQEITGEPLRQRLCLIARKRKYNVLATAPSLDKLAKNFLISVLNKGKLNEIKIIRPFLYIREHLFEETCNQKNMPSRPSKLFTQALDGTNSILRVQEMINPNVYENIKCALKPLMKLEYPKSQYELLKMSLTTRE